VYKESVPVEVRIRVFFYSVSVCTEFKISCKILNMMFVCLFVGVSEFVLIGNDALQSKILSSVTKPQLVRVLCADCKGKQGFGCVESESFIVI